MALSLAKVGLQYWITPDTLEFTLSGGGAIPMKGDPWTSFVMGNALQNFHAGPAFFGGGVGLTTTVKTTRKADIDVIGDVGLTSSKRTPWSARPSSCVLPCSPPSVPSTTITSS